MDGKMLKEQLRLLLNESTGSGFLDNRTSFEYLYDAACITAEMLQNLKAQTELTTVAGQIGYKLPADFLSLYLKDNENRFFVKYTDGDGNDQFIKHAAYEDVVYSNNTSNAELPSRYSVIDYPSLASNITGTVTSASDDVGGKSSLIDTGADFSEVSIGDVVHNTVDDSLGYVVEVTSGTRLEVCMFGGTDNEWDTSDTYIIVLQGRMQIILDPPPANAGETVTVHYIQKPTPVYSDYDTYRFQPQYVRALVHYAAWSYKYRDSEPDFGDRYYVFWLQQLKMNKFNSDRGIRKKGFTVNRKKRR
jgi:hypothetical protein